MKKLISLLLCTILLASTFTSCAFLPPIFPNSPDPDTEEFGSDGAEGPTEDGSGDAATPDEELESLKRKLAGDWSMYLMKKESMCLRMLWMVEYLEDFYGDPNVATLNKARAAVSAILNEFSYMTPPEYNVTPEQHTQLITAGCDVSGFLVELNRLESIKESYIDTCQNLNAELYASVFFLPLLECTKAYTDYLTDSIDNEMQMSAVYTDALIFSLQSETIRGDFRQYLKENAPLLNEYLPTFSTNETVISMRMNDALDDLEELTEELNILVGREDLENRHLEEVLQDPTGEQFAALRLNLPDGAAFPLPAFLRFEKANYTYYYSGEDGELQPVLSETPISFVPNRIVLKMPDVTKPEYQKYVLCLVELDCELLSVDDTATAYRSTFKVGSSYVVTELEDGTATITVLGDDAYGVPMYCYP